MVVTRVLLGEAREQLAQLEENPTEAQATGVIAWFARRLLDTVTPGDAALTVKCSYMGEEVTWTCWGPMFPLDPERGNFCGFRGIGAAFVDAVLHCFRGWVAEFERVSNMVRKPISFEEIGVVMSHAADTIDEAVVAELLKGNCCAGYAAWNFYGYVWYANGKWYCEIWRYNQYRETIEADSLEGIMKQASDKYGED